MPTSFDLAPSTFGELHDLIGSAHQRFADLVADTPRNMLVGTWTSRDVAAHLLTVMNRYTEFSPDRLAAEPRGVDEINQREIAELGDLTTDHLLDRLRDEVNAMTAVWGPASGLALDTDVPFHGGGTLDVQSALTNAMGEFLVHGFDIAAAGGKPWPITQREATLLCRLATRVLPAYARRSNTETVDLVFEVDDLPPWTAHVRGPHVEVTAGAPAPGTGVSIRGEACAVALLLYGRTPPPALRLAISGAAPTFSVLHYFEQP